MDDPSQPYFERDGLVIWHGDSRMIAPGLAFDCVVTDPPYGLNLDGLHHGHRYEHERIAGDADTALRDWCIELAAGRPLIMFGSPKVDAPPGVKMKLIWSKGEHVGMGDLAWPWKLTHEEIYVFGEGFAGKRDGSVLGYHAVAGTVALRDGRDHPTEKPVSLMRALLGKCPAGWTILDPFMGAGPTLRAARDLGRQAIGIEEREDYCEAAVRRLRQLALPMFEAAAGG